MLYFDYCATTPVNKEVIKSFENSSLRNIGNPNSSHKLGVIAKKQIEESTKSIAELLNLADHEIIYTSGSSEANNLAIKGVCRANKGRHIITTIMEHSSVIAPINRLCNEGYEVDFVKLNNDGTVNLDDLKGLIKDDTVLVSVVGVDSELGIKQNINEVGTLLKNYPNCYFHVDATQMVGKTICDFNNVDLFSFSAHKFFGIKGVGCLVKQNRVNIEPQIDGGRSTTKYRSGTPAVGLISSLEKALLLSLEDFEEKQKYVNKISNEMKSFLILNEDVVINSTNKSIDQIINFSFKTIDANEFINILNEEEVYVSSKSACSDKKAASKIIMELYGDDKRARNSVRISISYETTVDEINSFKELFDKCYRKVKQNENNKV